MDAQERPPNEKDTPSPYLKWFLVLTSTILILSLLIGGSGWGKLWAFLPFLLLVVLARTLMKNQPANAPDESQSTNGEGAQAVDATYDSDSPDTVPLPVIQVKLQRTLLEEIEELKANPPPPYHYRLGVTYLFWKLWRITLTGFVLAPLTIVLSGTFRWIAVGMLIICLFLGTRRFMKWHINWIDSSVENGSLIRTNKEHLTWGILGSSDNQIAIDGETFITPEQTVWERIWGVQRLKVSNPDPDAEESVKTLRDILHAEELVKIRDYRRRIERLSSEYARISAELLAEIAKNMQAMSEEQARMQKDVQDGMRTVAEALANIKPADQQPPAQVNAQQPRRTQRMTSVPGWRRRPVKTEHAIQDEIKPRKE